MKILSIILLLVITSLFVFFNGDKGVNSMSPINPSQREAVALKAIKASYGNEESEYSTTLFATHHIEELESSYWEKHLGVETPMPQQVLDLLKLQNAWDDNQVFDFTLPDDVTSYVISVRFNEAGVVDEISMEG
jgi:hypothetical protein